MTGVPDAAVFTRALLDAIAVVGLACRLAAFIDAAHLGFSELLLELLLRREEEGDGFLAFVCRALHFLDQRVLHRRRCQRLNTLVRAHGCRAKVDFLRQGQDFDFLVRVVAACLGRRALLVIVRNMGRWRRLVLNIKQVLVELRSLSFMDDVYVLDFSLRVVLNGV